MRLIAAAVLVALASPALAHERCDMPKPGVHFSATIQFGHRDYETQQDFDRMLVRQQGVDVRSVSRSSDGCIMALIKDGNGWVTKYYDPDTGELKANTWENQGSGSGINFGID